MKDRFLFAWTEVILLENACQYSRTEIFFNPLVEEVIPALHIRHNFTAEAGCSGKKSLLLMLKIHRHH